MMKTISKDEHIYIYIVIAIVSKEIFSHNEYELSSNMLCTFQMRRASLQMLAYYVTLHISDIIVLNRLVQFNVIRRYVKTNSSSYYS